MLYVALEAADILSREGIEIEVVDLRTVSPLDREAIAATVKKTNKVIILHEHARTGGLAGEISAIINEEAFDDLDGPIVRLTSLDTPVPFSPPQEEFFLPKVSDLVREARRLHAYSLPHSQACVLLPPALRSCYTMASSAALPVSTQSPP